MSRTMSLVVCLLVAGASACHSATTSPPTTDGVNTAAHREPLAAADEEVSDIAPLAAAAARPLARPPSNTTGCAPGARCLKASDAGAVLASGTSVAQCRGNFADFLVPANTIPAGYAGPWFTPNLIETAHTGVPAGARPWRAFDPRQSSQRLAYLLALRNYAFSSADARRITPALTDDAAFLDPIGGTVPTAQRAQKWYPAPRMIYGRPSQPGSREAAFGMTLERSIPPGELGGNLRRFANYAVAYYDARGARTYARVWSTASPGRDVPNVARQTFARDSLVFKLLFSAARPADFPVDLLDGSVSVSILPNAGGVPVPVRLLQIDIAVKDERAGPTGWYFATYAYDRAAAGTSPWLKMVPVGLMWGNDPSGPPLTESWINPDAPAYARAHLGAEGRLNGPVDNPASACMSCHSTAQVPSLAPMLPPTTGPCAAQRGRWFRNLPGSTAFGRVDAQAGACETDLGVTSVSAADYSLQLAATVTRALQPTAPLNPCTWDDEAPPVLPNAQPARRPGPELTVYPVTRDPEP